MKRRKLFLAAILTVTFGGATFFSLPAGEAQENATQENATQQNTPQQDATQQATVPPRAQEGQATIDDPTFDARLAELIRKGATMEEIARLKEPSVRSPVEAVRALKLGNSRSSAASRAARK